MTPKTHRTPFAITAALQPLTEHTPLLKTTQRCVSHEALCCIRLFVRSFVLSVMECMYDDVDLRWSQNENRGSAGWYTTTAPPSSGNFLVWRFCSIQCMQHWPLIKGSVRSWFSASAATNRAVGGVLPGPRCHSGEYSFHRTKIRHDLAVPSDCCRGTFDC